MFRPLIQIVWIWLFLEFCNMFFLHPEKFAQYVSRGLQGTYRLPPFEDRDKEEGIRKLTEQSARYRLEGLQYLEEIQAKNRAAMQN